MPSFHLWLKSLPLLLLSLFFVHVMPTDAHGYIVRSIPEDRSTLERAPARLQYWFSEALEPDFSEINLRDDRGDILASGGVSEQDNTLLTVQVPQDLPDGAYIVELRPAFASDGHVVAESRVFFVGEEVGGIQSIAASDTPEPLEIVWKMLFFNASYLLFGTAMLYTFVLVPVWGNNRYPQGLLPPRVMRRLNIIMLGAIFLAAYANVMGLFQQTMVFFNTSLDLVLSGGLWNVVRIGSRFGDVWHFRMLMLLIILIMQGASMFYAERFPRFVRSFWTANTYAIALLLGAQAVNSHAAGSLVMPWNALMVHWLHAISVAFWVGGILALVLVLPVALRPYDDETRWQALRPLMARFSRYVVGAVIVVIISGIYSATNWFYSPSDFLTTYGAALAYKTTMVGLLLFIGALHHIALRPHLLEQAPLSYLTTLVNKARNFGITMRLEAIVVVITLGLAAMVSATPIPTPEFLSDTQATPTENRRVGNYEVQLTVAPGAPGINSIDVTVRRNVLLIDDVDVELQFVLPSQEIRSDWLVAENVSQGLYAIVDDSIDTEGEWLILLDIIEDDGQLTRMVFEWTISEDAGVLDSISPSIVHLSAAFAVLGAVIYVLTPALRRLANNMQWTATNIVISIGTILMTIIALVASAWFLEYQADQLALRENPPPKIINTIVPDMGSIGIGGGLVQTQCTGWTANEDFDLLTARITTLRDDTLYSYTLDGWRDLPACDANLTTTQRWHIVNYLRTLRD